MKSIWIIVLSLMLSFQLTAQRQLKYSRVHEVVLQNNLDKSYSLLLAFQKQDPKFANAYFQLALIAEYWAKDYDPLTEPRLVRFFADKTRLYYGLCELKLKEESKGNREYYENAGIIPADKKLTLEEVNVFVTKKADEMVEYEKNINEITSYFEKTVEYYNQCVSNFKEINNDYTNIKNIYLSEDPELIVKLNTISTAFDSSLYYFQKYRAVLDRFPIKNYNQHYTLKSIETYRLDGLTQTNFLKNDIVIWDYSAWVKNVKETMSKNVSTNKTDLQTVFSEMESKLKALEKESYSDGFSPYNLDEKFVYKIEKFDPQSLLTALFRYREAQIELQTLFRTRANQPKSTYKVSLKSHTEFVQKYLKKQAETDSLLNLTESRISAKNIQKYQKFYLQTFNGLTGLKDYIPRQKIFLKNNQDLVFERYRNRVYDTRYPIVPKHITFKHKTELLIPEPKDGTTENGSYLTVFEKNATGYFIGGYKLKSGIRTAFFAIADSLGTVSSLTAGKIGVVTAVSENENQAVFCTQTSDAPASITLTKLSSDGKQTDYFTLETGLKCTALLYDALNDETMMVLSEQTENESNIQNFEVYRIKTTDTTLPLPVKLAVQGTVFDLYKSDDDIFVYFNCKSYIGTDEKLYLAEAERNILSVEIDAESKVAEFKLFSSTDSVIGFKAVKISSNNIAVSGVVSLPEAKPNAYQSKPLFLLQIDMSKNIKYSSLTDKIFKR